MSERGRGVGGKNVWGGSLSPAEGSHSPTEQAERRVHAFEGTLRHADGCGLACKQVPGLRLARQMCQPAGVLTVPELNCQALHAAVLGPGGKGVHHRLRAAGGNRLHGVGMQDSTEGKLGCRAGEQTCR